VCIPARPRQPGALACCATQLVFVYRHRTNVADSAVRPGLRRVGHRAATAAPRHMPTIAGTPHRADRPASVAIVVADRAARRRHHNPAPISFAHEVVREVVTPCFGHCDVVPRTTDTRARREPRHRDTS
jgi:hypothetical protein